MTVSTWEPYQFPGLGLPPPEHRSLFEDMSLWQFAAQLAQGVTGGTIRRLTRSVALEIYVRKLPNPMPDGMTEPASSETPVDPNPAPQ